MVPAALGKRERGQMDQYINQISSLNECLASILKHTNVQYKNPINVFRGSWGMYKLIHVN